MRLTVENHAVTGRLAGVPVVEGRQHGEKRDLRVDSLKVQPDVEMRVQDFRRISLLVQ